VLFTNIYVCNLLLNDPAVYPIIYSNIVLDIPQESEKGDHESCTLIINSSATEDRKLKNSEFQSHMNDKHANASGDTNEILKYHENEIPKDNK